MLVGTPNSSAAPLTPQFFLSYVSIFLRYTLSHFIKSYRVICVMCLKNDAVLNGFVEGWFAIDYLDPRNTPHTATGHFRIKITN